MPYLSSRILLIIHNSFYFHHFFCFFTLSFFSSRLFLFLIAMARTFRRSTSRFSRRRRYRRGFARNLFRPTRFSRASAVGLGGTSYVSSVKNMLLAIDWKSGQNASTIKRWAPLGLPKSGGDISRIPTIQGHDQRFYQLLMLYDKVRIRSCSFELVVPVPAGTAIKATDDAQGDTDQLQFGLGGISIVSRFIRAGTKDTDVSNLGASASQLSVPGVVVTRSRNKDGYLMLRYNFAPRNAAEMNSWWSCRVYSAQDSSLANTSIPIRRSSSASNGSGRRTRRRRRR